MLLKSFAISLLLLSVGWSTLRAQTIAGRITDDLGRPVSVALLTLLDGQGAAVRTALTNATGDFSFTAGRPGTFRLRVERIGLATYTTPAFDLAADQVRAFPLTLTPAPITLVGVRAETSTRCRIRPEVGGGIAALWQEARKGLGIAAAVEAARIVRLTVINYTRELDGTEVAQTAVHSRRTLTTTQIPFGAIPATTLARDGFVVPEPDGAVTYYGPSAATLLSDPFLDQHCFNRVVDNLDEPALVGLGFEPVRGTMTIGIQGTLWLDRGSAEIRSVDYVYVDPTDRIPDGGRGRVEFVRLTGGALIISRWWIRMPSAMEHPVQVRSGVLNRVTSFQEEGGVVLNGSGLPVGADDGILAQLDTGTSLP